MNGISRKQPGFTIVELLIVIVVIGTLAAITIVAYRGIQQRATTAAVNSAADQWEKIIRMELALQGNFASTGLSCLGRGIEDFPEADEFDAGVCVKANGISITYDEGMFEGWSVDRPDGELPITSYDLEGGTIKARGMYGVFVHSSPPYAGFQWVPQVAGQCGRGQSVPDMLGDTYTPGVLTGDMCALEIKG